MYEWYGNARANGLSMQSEKSLCQDKGRESLHSSIDSFESCKDVDLKKYSEIRAIDVDEDTQLLLD